MAANLNQLFEAIGSLTAEVQGLRRDVQEDRKAAASYRAVVREEISGLVVRATRLEADMAAVSGRVEAMRRVTDDVVELRARAAGAGTLGRWLVRIGIAVVTLAGWAVAALDWLTGRPPP